MRILNLELLVFVEGGKPENPEKNPPNKARTNNKLNPHMTPGRNQTRGTLDGGERSHHCDIPALHLIDNCCFGVSLLNIVQRQCGTS